jgi:hypothetical protein
LRIEERAMSRPGENSGRLTATDAVVWLRLMRGVFVIAPSVLSLAPAIQLPRVHSFRA